VIKTRRISFEHASTSKHFAGGDPVMSHVVANLSACFPEGEDFFVRSVRHYRDRVTDPALKKDVGGFIGQEAIHGREHRVLNDKLRDLGYPTRAVDRSTKFALGVGERVLPRAHQLAITAALEHYTATLAEVLMADERARAIVTDDEIRNLLLWHALEESEHKAVAFDVLQAVSGKHHIRVGVFWATTIGFLGSGTVTVLLSLLRDRDARRHPGEVVRRVRALRDSPWLTKAVRRRIADYARRDFHPNDHDAAELTARWRAELFGDEGTLVAKLAS
jgi:predicted metal-dependent hydrolase